MIAACFLLLVTVVRTKVGYHWLSAAVPINDGVLSMQEVEPHSRTHSMICSDNSSSARGYSGSRSVHYFASRSFGNIAGQGGAGLFQVVIFYFRWVHFLTEVLFLVEYDIYLDSCFDRNIVFGRIRHSLIYCKGEDR